MKHTPGPWESLDDCVRVDRPNDPDHHMMVCSIPGFLTGNKANARLIAAAPELVEACWDAISQIEYLKGLLCGMQGEVKDHKLRNENGNVSDMRQGVYNLSIPGAKEQGEVL